MMAVAAAVAVTSFLLFQPPAGAAEHTAIESGYLDYLNFEGRPIRCEATVDAVHNTDDADAPLLTWSIDATGGEDCAGSYKVIATYKDENGRTRSVRYTATEPTFGGVDGAYTATSVTLEIDYTACHPEQNDTCTLTVTASPK
jgi:hypothetical protein